MANFVLTTHWTSGEVLPFIRLGICLRQRGHRVTLLTHCHYADMARRAGLDFTAWDTPEQWRDFLDDSAQMGDPLGNPAAVERFNQKYGGIERCLAEYDKVIRHCKAADTVIVARHLSSTAAFVAAEKLRLPLVSTFVAPSFVRQVAIDAELYGQSLVKNLNAVRNSIGLAPVGRWRDWACSPKRSFGFWPEWFAPPDHTWPLQISPIGFPAPDLEEEKLPAEVQALTSAPTGAVLIFGGTGKQLHPRFYAASIDACSRVERQCLVVTPHPDLLPRRLPENVTWFDRLPFASVMPLVAAVIHHGGIGTTGQALAAGKPQLILPDYFDRPANAAHLKQLGVAEHLPVTRWRPPEIASALMSLLTPERQQRCRELAARMSFRQFAITVHEQLEPMVSNPDFVMPSSDSYTSPPDDSQLARQIPLAHTAALQAATAKVTGEKRALLIRWLREKQTADSTTQECGRDARDTSNLTPTGEVSQ